jgi:glucose/arabinose dehydrogenase
MRRLMMILAVLLLLGAGACRLLPERFAIRGPILSSLLGRGIESPDETVVQSRFVLPDGYSVEIFAEGIENARVMRLSPGGDLLVSQPKLGRVLHVLRDRDGDGRSDGQRVLVDELDRPHGLDFHAGALYIGETGSIARVAIAEDGPDSLRVTGAPERIVTGLPAGGNHWSRTLRFGPDGGLYLHVGSSCNVCEEEDPRRATLLRFEPDGSGEEIFAAGLRNSVGFDWQPGTGALYATDNGRDLLGDDYPPCELNRIERGAFYGWPYANGDRNPDPDFGTGQSERIATSRPPAHGFRAHNAPLGITFLRHPGHPESLRGAALVALHGSWNRTRLDGYKVVSLHWRPDGSIEERDFLVGFERDEQVIGRPADVLEDRDGSILVSDDYSGTIYRVRRGAPSAGGGVTLSADRRRPARSAEEVLANLDPATRNRLDAAGATLFEEYACGSCHLKAQAGPGVVARPLQALATRYTLDELTRFLRTPTPPMPAFDLSEEERRALSVHLLNRFE